MLFNYVVRAGEHGGQHGEAECLSGLEIYHQIEFSRRLHRKVGGLLTLVPPEARMISGESAATSDADFPKPKGAALKKPSLICSGG